MTNSSPSDKGKEFWGPVSEINSKKVSPSKWTLDWGTGASVELTGQGRDMGNTIGNIPKAVENGAKEEAVRGQLNLKT